MRRRAGLIFVAAVSVAACGSSSPTADPGTAPPEAATAEPAVVTTEAPADEPADEPATGDPGAAASEPADKPAAATDGDGDAGDQSVAPPPEPTEPAEPVEPVAARLDDGCSLDNSPTTPEAAAGPPPAIDVRAESASSPLPDLAVRRINCAGGWVNLKNELPSEQALLVWFWAPH